MPLYHKWSIGSTKGKANKPKNCVTWAGLFCKSILHTYKLSRLYEHSFPELLPAASVMTLSRCRSTTLHGMTLHFLFQGLLDRKSLFRFAVHIAQFKIQPDDWNKCQTSFYGYARELATLRDGLSSAEQKEMFDLEVRGVNK